VPLKRVVRGNTSVGNDPSKRSTKEVERGAPVLSHEANSRGKQELDNEGGKKPRAWDLLLDRHSGKTWKLQGIP